MGITAGGAAAIFSTAQAYDAKVDTKKETTRLAKEKADAKKKLAASSATASDATSRRLAAQKSILTRRAGGGGSYAKASGKATLG